MARRSEVGVTRTRLWVLSAAMATLVAAVAAVAAVACGVVGTPVAGVPADAPAGADNVAVSDLDAAAPNDTTPTTPRAIQSEDASKNAQENTGASAEIAAGMAQIGDGLGYALVPSDLPDGFELVAADLADIPGSPMATVFYENGGARLSLFYPAFFVPEFGPTQREGLFLPPADAIIRVVVAGELAYLMRGEWDEDTIQLLASYTAQWEYNGRLTLYFEYRRETGRNEWAMLSANTQTVDWIGVSRLIGIAESMDPFP